MVLLSVITDAPAWSPSLVLGGVIIRAVVIIGRLHESMGNVVGLIGMVVLVLALLCFEGIQFMLVESYMN